MSTKQPLFQREVSDPEDKIQETLRALSHETIASVTYQRNIVKVKPRQRKSKSKSKRIELNPSDFMSPLSFENIEVKNTPLSSLRSCSEYNHNVGARPTKDCNSSDRISSGGFWSRLMFWNRPKIRNSRSSVLSINDNPKGKKNLRVRFQDLSSDSYDERLYLVEKFQFNAANLNEDEIMEYQSFQYINERPLSGTQQSTSTAADTRQLTAFLDASLQEYQATCFAAQAISQNTYRRNPRHSSNNNTSYRTSFFEESSKAVDYLFGYHSPSTSTGITRPDKSRHHHEEKIMEIELQNFKEPEVIPADQASKMGFPLPLRLFSNAANSTVTTRITSHNSLSSNTGTNLVGNGGNYNNGCTCGLLSLTLPLSLSRTTTSSSSDYHLGLDDSNHSNTHYHHYQQQQAAATGGSTPSTPLSGNSNNNSLRRGHSLRSVDRLPSMTSLTSNDVFLPNGTTATNTLASSNTTNNTMNTTGTFESDTNNGMLVHGQDYRTHIFPFCQICYTQINTRYQLQQRLQLFRTWYTSYLPLYSRDFYDALRLQPFSCGAYLRAMLLAGLSSMLFHIYNAITWPVLPSISSSLLNNTQQYAIYCFYTILMIQIVLHLLSLPFRLRIHFLCWESSRAIEMDHAMELIHYLLRSDSWLLNTFLGRVMDSLAGISLLLSELYLLSTGSSFLTLFLPSNNNTISSSGSTLADPLHPLIISLSATNLLPFVCRILIATIFAYTLSDPNTQLEARKRGLTKWDVENLPAFVFTPPDQEDMNNTDCAICLNTFELGEMIISLPCDRKHSFHGNCIRQWLLRQNSCPLCQRLV